MMTNPLIALSMGDSEDLADLGYGTEHLDDLTLRLAKRLMTLGARLAYGGVLRPDHEVIDEQHSFLDILLDVAAEEGTRNAKAPPLVNYQPWPWYEQVDTAKRAKHFGVIQFVNVDPPGEKVEESDERFPWAMASACTQMRRWMTDGTPSDVRPPVVPCAARVVLGGKRRDWAGILPGIAEEVLYMLEATRPVYLLGGYGGCTKAIADYLCGDDDELPAELTLAGHASSPKLQAVQSHAPPGHVEDAFARLESALKSVRADPERLNNGLTAEENTTLMQSENVRVIGQLLTKGLREAGDRGSP